jgi:ribosomal protein L37AE/L43A
MAEQQSLQRVRGEGIQKCPECGSTELVRKDKEIYCKKCGAVIE